MDSIENFIKNFLKFQFQCFLIFVILNDEIRFFNSLFIRPLIFHSTTNLAFIQLIAISNSINSYFLISYHRNYIITIFIRTTFEQNSCSFDYERTILIVQLFIEMLKNCWMHDGVQLIQKFLIIKNFGCNV